MNFPIIILPALKYNFVQVKNRPTKRAPDVWESARFQAVCVVWSWFRQNGVASSRPPAGNAPRSAVHTTDLGS